MIQRCFENCVDDNNTSYGTNTGPSNGVIKKCTISCVDKNLPKITEFQSKIEQSIFSINQR